ncbi:MAG: lmo0937 family membrane protein [Sphingobacteriales bacterium]|nr:MAG: lmo0937 family membrane protein [Sphingobacteriales bacterium]
MRGLLYVIAVILLIGWLLGVFVYSVKGLIHILLVLAIISLILGFIRRGTID